MATLRFFRTAEAQQVGPPSIGLVAEELRRTLVDKFDIAFPALTMETQNDGRIVLHAKNDQVGMDFTVEIKDLGGGAPGGPGQPPPGQVPGPGPGPAGPPQTPPGPSTPPPGGGGLPNPAL